MKKSLHSHILITFTAKPFEKLKKACEEMQVPLIT